MGVSGLQVKGAGGLTGGFQIFLEIRPLPDRKRIREDRLMRHFLNTADYTRTELQAMLDGDPAEWPDDLRVREYPKAVTP